MTQSLPAITGFGAYIPRMRLERSAIGSAMAWQNQALRRQKGQRAVAAWDEDVVTMSAEAMRDARVEGGEGAHAIILASTSAPFAERLNAAIAAGALDLPRHILAMDNGGSHRSGTTGLITALGLGARGRAIVAAAECRPARPGSQQELVGGDAGAAIIFGGGEPLARTLGSVSLTSDFVDHWRAAGERYEYQWEERWIREEGYLKLVPEAVWQLLGETNTAAEDIDHFILASPLKGVAKVVQDRAGLTNAALPDDLLSPVGHVGAAHPLLLLASVLEEARPGAKILVAGFGSGCDALLFEATESLSSWRPRRGVAGWLAEGSPSEDYLKYLSLRGEVNVDWGPRAEFGNKFAPTVNARASRETLAFIGGRDKATGVVQFPKSSVGIAPGATGLAEYEDVRLADEGAVVVAVTADWLTYHPSPPFYFGLVQFKNGARMPMEFVDVAGRVLEVGTTVEMAFRIKEIDTMRGYRQYFWKAVPAKPAAPEGAA